MHVLKRTTLLRHDRSCFRQLTFQPRIVQGLTARAVKGLKKADKQKASGRLAVFRLQRLFDSICSSHLYTMQHTTEFVYLSV